MKILRVAANARKRAFEVSTKAGKFHFPFAAVRPSVSADDPLVRLAIDPELAREGFVYTLRSGAEGVVHIDYVLEFNRDPDYLSKDLLYRLTVLARDAVSESHISTRELIRRLGTSPSQFYRLLDPTNSTKSMTQLLALLGLVGCEIDMEIRSGIRPHQKRTHFSFKPAEARARAKVPLRGRHASSASRR